MAGYCDIQYDSLSICSDYTGGYKYTVVNFSNRLLTSLVDH